MPRYIDARQIRYCWMYDDDGTEHVGVTLQSVIDRVPTADVVEIETIRKWLYEIAINNVGNVIEGDFSNACEEIISRLDGLRKFAQEDEPND